jgi:NADH:ubiquinone oxidoreductase subunit 5 (subunit L)/multisubunit Na+/H+ antiporter MnhA subunit
MNERDIKKLIAYSTIRHVSLIIYFLRFGLFKIVYFHLNIHAIFKSLIFICFGFLMLRSYHSQDKRIVSMKNLNPVIKIVYYFSCLCLAGLPFLRGFFSKDLIIEKLIENRLEFSFTLSLLLFLRVRIYYRIKLARLSNVIFSYGIVEKRTLGMVRILLIRFIIIGLINIYLSLIFRLRLEFFSFKVAVYMFIFGFFLLRILTRLNYKISIYDKIQNFKETWFLDFYSIDKFVY